MLTANYAIYYENRKLWEAKGDVVVVKSDGKTLYTQQLFWNAKTQRIYSNVDTKIVQNEGGNVFQGEGFESDEAFKGVAFPPLHGENGCRCEPGGRRTVRIGSCRRGRPAGRRKDAAVRDPPACRLGREGTDRCRTRAGA